MLEGDSVKIKIGVIFGGKSVEHELSIMTAVQAMEHIDQEKYEVVPIYITKDLQMYSGGMLRHIDSFKDFDLIRHYAKRVNLVNKKGRFVLETTGLIRREYNEIHLAFPMMHGANTEDGSIQGYLQILGIPYVGNNIYTSSLGQDKVFVKQILEQNGLPVTNYIWFFASDYLNNKEELFKKLEKLHYPLVIKPATLGSSIGIAVINRKEELESAIEKAIKFDRKVIVEEKISNLVEYNCSVLGTYDKMQVSDIEEFICGDNIRQYKDKYTKYNEEDAKIKRECPAKIGVRLKDEIEKDAKEVYRLINAQGTARIDFLYDNKNKKIYIDEVNTIPNYFSYHLWEDKNISYKVLLEYMIKDAIKLINIKDDMDLVLDTDLMKGLTAKDIREMK